MNFIEGLKSALNTTYTDNGMKAMKSTCNANVDFFGSADLFTDKDDVLTMFRRAYDENKMIAVLNLLYFRDINKGKGVRKNFRICAEYLINVEPMVLEPLFKILASGLGRTDDLHFLLNERYDNTYIQSKYASILYLGLAQYPLTAKWLPSKGSKSNRRRTHWAKRLAKLWGLTQKEYRHYVVNLRKSLDLVETKVCREEYGDIDYSHVPSLAMLRYRHIFSRKDEERFEDYLEEVQTGTKKMNTATLSPVDLTKNYVYSIGVPFLEEDLRRAGSDYLNTAWAEFKKPDTYKETLVVADLSGSMTSGMGSYTPMAVSIAGALYATQFNTGIFKDTFLSFSSEPVVATVKGDNFTERLLSLSEYADCWGMSTDIEKVIEVVYEAAKNSKDICDRITIITDGEFNAMVRNCNSLKTVIKHYKEELNKLGLKMPEIVFWNVNANKFHFSANDSGVILISGFSTAIFETVFTADIPTPFEFMAKTLVDTYFKNNEHIELYKDLIKIFME